MQWDNNWNEEFYHALKNAFNHSSLERLLLFKLDERLSNIVNINQSFDDVVFRLILHAQEHDWIFDLLNAAVEKRPDNSELINLSRKITTILTKNHNQEQNQSVDHLEHHDPIYTSSVDDSYMIETMENNLDEGGFANFLATTLFIMLIVTFVIYLMG